MRRFVLLAALLLLAPASGALAAAPPPPVVSGLSPSSGPVAGGTKVTVHGSGFLDATAVHFASTKASFVIVSDAEITATAPPRPSGPAHVVVTTAHGETAETGDDLFTYRPKITDLSVASGTVSGGTDVTITGDGFTGATKVLFGDRPAQDFSVVSDTRIDAVTPPNDRGQVDVQVVANGAPTPTVDADQFTYLLKVTDIDPGSAAVGAQVHVRGIGFDDASAVRFDSRLAGFVILSDTELIALAPSGSGAADVTVVTPHGTTTVVAAARFSYGSGSPAGAGEVATPTTQGASSGGDSPVQVTPTAVDALELRLLGGLSLSIPRHARLARIRAQLFVGRAGTTSATLLDPRGRSVPLQLTARTRPRRTVTFRTSAGHVPLSLLAPAVAIVHGRYRLVLVSRDAAGRRATLRLTLTA